MSFQSPAMKEASLKVEEGHKALDPEEVFSILSSLTLTSVTLGDFLVINRSNFDVMISEEPYIGLQFQEARL